MKSIAAAGAPSADAATHRRILSGLLWVSLFMLLAKLAGAAKEMALAARFGVGPVVDAYGLVFTVATWPAAVAMSVLMLVLIPLEARLRREGEADPVRFRREVLGIVLLVGAAASALVWWLLPPTIVATAAPSVQAHALAMLPALAPMTAVALLASLLSVWLMSGGRHANSALDGVPAFVLLVALLVVPGVGPGVLAWGTLGGFALQCLLLMILLHRDGQPLLPAWRTRSPAWRLMAGGLTLSVFGQVLVSATAVIDNYIAAPLGPGVVATLGYANRLLGLVISLVALASTRAMLPVLSESVRSSAVDSRDVAARWTVRLVVAGALLAVPMWFGAEWMTRLLFERGEFTPADTQAVASVLRIAATQLPFYLAATALTSYAAASERFRLVLASSLVMAISRPLFGWWLSRTWGVEGIAASQTIAAALSTVCLLWVLKPIRGKAST